MEKFNGNMWEFAVDSWLSCGTKQVYVMRKDKNGHTSATLCASITETAHACMDAWAHDDELWVMPA